MQRDVAMCELKVARAVADLNANKLVKQPI